MGNARKGDHVTFQEKLYLRSVGAIILSKQKNSAFLPCICCCNENKISGLFSRKAAAAGGID